MLNRIDVIKKIDQFIGPGLVSFATRLFTPRKNVKQSINKLLVIRPGGIGDAVLLIPILTALKSKLPYVTIDLLAEKRNSQVFTLCPAINRVFHYHNAAELLSVIRGYYDVVIDTEQWHRLSSVVARSTRAPISIGFATNERKKAFTLPVPYSLDEYEMDSFFSLIALLDTNVNRDPGTPFLSIPSALTSKAVSLLSTVASCRIVVLFPGGSIAEKKWGSSRYQQLAAVLNEQGYGTVVVGGKDDIKAGQEIVIGLPNALNLCGKLSLPETAAVLKESSLLITGDSGIMHIGYGLGIKIVALFGPGQEKKWAPRSPRVAILNKHLPCSPCTVYGNTPICQKNVACMKEISVQEVIESTLALLQKD